MSGEGTADSFDVIVVGSGAGLVGAKTPQEKKIMRAEITPRSGSNTARDACDMARRRPQSGTIPEREGPTGALLAAAERDKEQAFDPPLRAATVSGSVATSVIAVARPGRGDAVARDLARSEPVDAPAAETDFTRGERQHTGD